MRFRNECTENGHLTDLELLIFFRPWGWSEIYLHALRRRRFAQQVKSMQKVKRRSIILLWVWVTEA